jgi:hypothetical protein
VRLILIAIVGMTIAGCASPGTSLSHRDFGIADVPSFADTLSAVRALGAPAKRYRVADAHNLAQPADSANHQFDYSGLALIFGADGRLRAIALSSSAHATVRGLRVGDDTARVRQLYGPPEDASGSSGRTWIYSGKAGGPSMLLNLAGQKVEFIAIAGQP